jgi:hypothetical protein
MQVTLVGGIMPSADRRVGQNARSWSTNTALRYVKLFNLTSVSVFIINIIVGNCIVYYIIYS